jgi:CRISPR system Cascade subunit CasA
MALQAYAPPGGGGHRGSLRGGGPLTTLVWPRQAGDAEPRLWDVVWSNVPPSSAAPSLDPFSAFPWMQPAAASDRGEVVSPGSAPAALAFFGCPRRIRLDFEDGAAVGLRSRPQGASYRGWVHPLSPYRRDPAGQLVAVHPRDEAFSYAQLPACWGLNGRAAAAVAAWPRRHRAAGGAVAETRLRIFGFDTENAKVRRWIEVEAPLLVIEDEARAAAVRALAEAAEAAGRALRHALRTVRFGRRTPSGYVLDNPAAIKDGGLSLEHFRRASEADFLRYAKGLALGLNGADGWQESFAGALHRAAAASFCNALDLEAETRRDAARLTRARAALDASFAAGGAVARILAPFRGAR